MPKHDLDALLGEPLELVLGGKTYLLAELSVRQVAELQKADLEDDPWRFLRLVLGPLGLTDDDLQALDQRKALAATALIAKHFTELPEEMKKAAPGLAAAVSTGETSSPGSSGSSQATG